MKMDIDPTVATSPADAGLRQPAVRSVTLALTCIAAFMTALDVTIVNIAMPSIRSGLGGTMAGLQWIGAGYTLTFGSLLLAGGTLSDRHGARSMFIIGVLIFSAGSLACGLSGGLLVLNLSRILQGCGAALIVPSTLALLRETHPDRHERTRAIAIYAASGGIAQVSGPIVGGFLVSAVGWRSIFIVNVPLGIVVLITAVMRIPPSPAKPSRTLDLPGQLAAVIWLVSLAAALIEGGQLGWVSLPVVACCALSFAALAAFALVERNAREPMLPVEDLRGFRTARLLVIAIILGFAYFGQFFVLAIFFQDEWGATPVAAGLAFLPMTIGVTVSNLVIGPRVGRIGTRIPMACGQLLCALGYLALSRVGPATDYLLIGVLFAAVGIGGGLIVPAMTSAMLEAVPPERSGIASGVLNAGRQMGSVVGIALFGSLVARAGLVAGLRHALIIAAIAMAAGCILSLLAEPTRHVEAAS